MAHRARKKSQHAAEGSLTAHKGCRQRRRDHLTGQASAGMELRQTAR